jgi:integrase
VASRRIVTRNQVVASDELERLLEVARKWHPRDFPLILFLADTGARFGEATARCWIDVDLARQTAPIGRSFSSGKHLGPTKTGRERTVELSARLAAVLASQRPDLFPDGALVFPNEAGGFIDPGNFRNRVFDQVVRRALGRGGKRITPHSLCHTFASLHLARGTPINWVQAMGGWASATMLLDRYGHFMREETTAYADALGGHEDGTRRHPGRSIGDPGGR